MDKKQGGQMATSRPWTESASTTRTDGAAGCEQFAPMLHQTLSPLRTAVDGLIDGRFHTRS